MTDVFQAQSLRILVRNSEDREQNLKVTKIGILSNYLFQTLSLGRRYKPREYENNNINSRTALD